VDLEQLSEQGVRRHDRAGRGASRTAPTAWPRRRGSQLGLDSEEPGCPRFTDGFTPYAGGMA
jgi:hypothetical protein